MACGSECGRVASPPVRRLVIWTAASGDVIAAVRCSAAGRDAQPAAVPPEQQVHPSALAVPLRLSEERHGARLPTYDR
jgi:hypothetical protein